MERLPRELVSNILSRLPSIELLKFKCVCKLWFNLLTDPHFISNYYVVYNKEEDNNFLVIRSHLLSGLKTYISILSCSEKFVNVSSQALNLPFDYNSSDHKYLAKIMGPCNGIYFLEGSPNVLINPSLRQCRVLPKSQFAATHGSYSLIDFAGFGFDNKTNDYKVVVLKDLWLKEYEYDERKIGYWTAELYSLNGNCWRKLDDDALLLSLEIWCSSQVYNHATNCCHWAGYVDEPGGRIRDVVLAFDMVNELFRKIKVPNICCSGSGECFTTLVPFNDSATVGLVVYPVRGLEKSFDVWVMKNYWDEGSWVKQYNVGPVSMIGKLVGFYGNNRFLYKDGNERLVLYANEYEHTLDHQVCGKYDIISVARYMESLVSLQRGNDH